MQIVPAAICCTADHVPLAQRWNNVPPMQFHSPSVEQAEPGVCAPDTVEAGALEAAGVAADVATGVVDGVMDIVEEIVTGALGGDAAPLTEMVAKTPPCERAALLLGDGEAAAPPEPVLALVLLVWLRAARSPCARSRASSFAQKWMYKR